MTGRIGAGWWAAPADPGRWFSSERIAASRAYHAPLATAALLRGAGRLGGLLFVFVLARWRNPESDGYVAALVVGAAAGLVFAAVNSLTDVWMEYRHEPRFGSVPVAPDRFARVSVVSALVAVALGSLAALGLSLLARSTVWWPVVAVVLLVVFSAIVGPVSARLVHRHTAIDPEVRSELDLVAQSVGVADVQWGQLVGSEEGGMNALTLGLGGSRQILLTGELLKADPSLRNFVVAHEASHLWRHHHRVSFWVSSLGVGFEVGCLWLIDRTAVGSLGAAGLRVLHDHGRSDLAPGRLARCWSPHPTPAERLATAEHLARMQGARSIR